MNAAIALYAPYEGQAPAPALVPALVPVRDAALVLPTELQVLLLESPKMKASFDRLGDGDRRGFVRYIEEMQSVLTRERRAAIVAMSLIGLARDIRDDGSPFDAAR